MSDNVKIVTEECSYYMDRILGLFKPGAKITVLVRSPNVPGDTDFILTNDNLTEACKAIQWQQERKGES